MNRRGFLQTTTGTAIAAYQAKAGNSEEDFWSEIRNEFTTDRSILNMNNGYASPSPRVVQDAVRRYIDYSNMGPYHTMVRELYPKIENARRMLADAAGCDTEEIAITRNSSESLEIAQLGIDLKPGDEVLTTNQDYPRMLTTFRQRERRDGIKLKAISFPVPVTSMDDLYQRIEAAVTPRTKVILICHITNRTGQIFPVRRICDMARARGITTIVDGAHAFNQFPYKLSELNCDYYGVSLHKWTFAPMGSGFLYVRKSKIKDTWALMASSPSQDDNIRKFEEVGTHPAANFLGICEALQFNQNIGIERKSARLRYLRDRWSEQIAKSPKVKILHNPAPEMSCGIGMFGTVGADASKLVSALQTKYGIFTAYVPHEEYIGIRVTASVYTTPKEIDYFAKAVLTELA